MRRVVLVPIFNAFRSGLDRQRSDIEAPFFLKFRYLLNPTVLTSLVWVVLGLAAPWSRLAWILFLSVSIFVGFVFLDLKAKANSLLLRRTKSLEKKLREDDRIKVGLEIHNTEATWFDLHVIVEDHFGPSRDSLIQYAADTAISPRSYATLTVERKCDAQMGTHFIGPIKLRLRDAFGLFEFQIIDDEVLEIELLPKVKTIAPIPVIGSASSPHYGLYEVQSRGLSVNFSGIRPYVHGDSLRHVAWKISGKHNELMVKEFEKVVSCDITLILNMNPQLHVGLEHESTWYQAKSAALSIAKQQLDLGNSIQFITSNLILLPARGNDFFEMLTQSLVKLDPLNFGDERMQTHDILLRSIDQVQPSSTLFYITAFDQHHLQKDEAALAALRDRGVQIFVILIEPTSYLTREIAAVDYIANVPSKGPRALQESETRLKLAGMQVQVLRRGA